jgi:thioredoxin-related protein
MMIRSIFFTILFLLSSSILADAPDGYPFQPFDAATEQASDQGKPVFVYFGRFGCGYCEKTNKEAFSSEKVRKIYTDHYVLAYVDAESGKRLRLSGGERITERELGTRYNAFATPVFTFISPRGDSLLQLIGIQTIDDLLAADSQVQKKLSAGK